MFNTKTKQILDLIDENTFIISDTHFGHKRILDFEPVRLQQMKKDGFNEQDHDEWVISQWNSVIQPTDVVLHLGDFAFKNLDIQQRLNGRKILILGNHDRVGTQTYPSFEMVLRGMYIYDGNTYLHADSMDDHFSCLIKEINNRRILFSHYPCTTKEYRRPDMDKRINELIKFYDGYECDLNIHGHTHSECYQNDGCVNFSNVSFENIGMKPIRLGDIL
jgi:calcineurin-like phosphoesterase family protein